jgi:hypothetical protein
MKELVEMGGYFAEYFGGDLEKMCENIKNDFPIELGTYFNGKVDYFQQRNEETVKNHALEILDLCDTLLCVHADTNCERLYECAVEKIGRKNGIARKNVLGLPITKSEIDYLLK